ncbi:MAG TPA: hypothetical protein P5528_16165 [Steroidobacteraceae bacterium]|nr:hypothetical protein [Steroidobacteraceae bacterium]
MNNSIRIRIFRSFLAPMVMAILAGAAHTPANAADTFAAAVTGGKPTVGLRYRAEQVDEDSLRDEALASTLRVRLAYETAKWRDLSMLVEVDHVASIGGETFNSTRNGRIDRPVVADPIGTDLNQAALRFAGADDTIVLGRQRIIFDNARFVGNVGWRQNEQTYDGLTWQTKRLAQTTFTYGYIANVNRVFGPDSGTPAADLRSDSHVVHADVDLKAWGKLLAFGHLLDFDNAAALSQQTVGVQWTGTKKFDAAALSWSVAYASQSDCADNPTNYSADYRQLELAGTRGPITLRIGQEVLSGDATRPGRSFQTPLATLHAFQGWADKFLTTPPQGIEDLYVGLSGKWGATSAQLTWHDFGAEAVGRDYGSEWDASVSHRFGARVDVLLKAANYDANGFSVDTTKLWLQVAADFK